MGSGQLRRPVVAARKGQVISALETDFDTGEDGLRLFVPAALDTLGFRIVELEDVKDIGKAVGADRSAVLVRSLAHVRERSADVCL